jgi:asparagine synthase (glutamine-hydrolysing)
MFALALWDGGRSWLRLRRSIKPYYAIHNEVLYFASEIKALLPILLEIGDHLLPNPQPSQYRRRLP